jgi:arylsulfatase A-like enzyme
LGGGHSYVTDRGRGQRNILRGSTQVQETEYLTDAFRREAVAFIDRYKGESFFLYVPFNAVHAPMQGAENYLKRFDLIKENKRRTFAAMLAALDDAVGAIRSKVSECGLEEKTLIAFISDNGGPTAQTSSNNGPLRGFKGQVFEGGVRVPFMIAWPGKLPGGQTYEQPVIALDVHPTFLSAAGIAIPPEEKLDGVNLLPFLLGEKSGSPHQRLFWRFGAQKAVRQGDWKLIVGEGPAAGRRAVSGEMLFDLSKDLGEKTNLAQQKPEKLKELRMVLAEWEKELVAPKWRRGQGESD